MGRAGLAGESVLIKRARRIVLAPPLGVGLFGHGRRRLRLSITSEHLQVLGDGDLSRSVSKSVVCAESHDRDRHERVAGLCQQRGHPVDGQIVRVLSVGAASTKLIAGLGVDVDGVGAEERVKMRFAVLSREDDGVDVLVHERRRNVDLSVGIGRLDGEATGQQGGLQHVGVRRHDDFVLECVMNGC